MTQTPASEAEGARGHSFLASPSATLESLKRWGLHTKKSLGQHFLVDDNVIARICDLADVRGAAESGRSILEVGPGIGTLTVALIGQGARVICVERDRDLVPVATENASVAADGDARTFEILNMDALDLTRDILRQTSERSRMPMPSMLVANLPYAVAATLVLALLETIPEIETLCVMVQSEVADRMQASPGEKDYGAYSVKIGLHASTSGSFRVAPGSFLPPPRVDSTVIRLDRRIGLADPALLRATSAMADAAFYQRRKTIRNSVSAYLTSRGLPKGAVDDLLSDAGIDPSRRGETLSQDEFLELGRSCMYNFELDNWR